CARHRDGYYIFDYW
nr:immunoglobulin heavy chain junction region [Mus musculus]